MKTINKGLSRICIIICLLTMVIIQPVKVNAAKAKKMYLITAIPAGEDTEFFTYDKNGMLKTSKERRDGTYTYKYNKKLHISSVKNGNISYNFKYDKKNHLISAHWKNFIYRFYWKNNKMTSSTVSYDTSNHYGILIKYSYNKKGYIKKMVKKYLKANIKETVNYTWNKQGDLIKVRSVYGGYPGESSYKWTYKNGKPIKRAWSSGGTTYSPTTYKCKSVKVPAKYVKAVKAQQRCIRNEYLFEPGSAELGYFKYFGGDRFF